MLAVLLPELRDSIGFDQRSRYHDMTVDEHTFAVVDHACAVGAPETVRLAALLHDCGKPATAWGWVADGNGGYRAAPATEFHATPAAGAAAGRRPAALLCGPQTPGVARTRSREPNARSVRCCGSPRRPRCARRWCGSCASTCTATTTRSPGSPLARGTERARRFLQRIGPDTVEELMLLRRWDRAGKREALADGWDAELTVFETAVREQPAARRGDRRQRPGHRRPRAGRAGLRRTRDRRGQARLLEVVVEDPAANVPSVLRQAALRAAYRRHMIGAHLS